MDRTTLLLTLVSGPGPLPAGGGLATSSLCCLESGEVGAGPGLPSPQRGPLLRPPVTSPVAFFGGFPPLRAGQRPPVKCASSQTVSRPILLSGRAQILLRQASVPSVLARSPPCVCGFPQACPDSSPGISLIEGPALTSSSRGSWSVYTFSAASGLSPRALTLHPSSRAEGQDMHEENKWGCEPGARV